MRICCCGLAGSPSAAPARHRRDPKITVFWSSTKSKLALNNYGTRKTSILRKWLAKRRGFIFTSRPLVILRSIWWSEWFAELTNRRIRRGVSPSMMDLETATHEFIEVHNERSTPFV
jgi:hypothetical protein